MDGWSYFTWTGRPVHLYKLNDTLNALGADGWELVTSMSTVKSIINVTGNDIVLIFKKPGTGHTIDPDLMQEITGVDPTIAY